MPGQLVARATGPHLPGTIEITMKATEMVTIDELRHQLAAYAPVMPEDANDLSAVCRDTTYTGRMYVSQHGTADGEETSALDQGSRCSHTGEAAASLVLGVRATTCHG